jgi:ABC-type Fe3+ transport system permease subunit
VPKELEDAATMDGCSRFGFFWRILLPLTKPGLATVAIFTFVASWNNFFWPLIATNSDATRTLPVDLATIVGGAGMSMKQSVLIVSAVVATLPTALFFLALQRHSCAASLLRASKAEDGRRHHRQPCRRMRRDHYGRRDLAVGRPVRRRNQGAPPRHPMFMICASKVT